MGRTAERRALRRRQRGRTPKVGARRSRVRRPDVIDDAPRGDGCRARLAVAEVCTGIASGTLGRLTPARAAGRRRRRAAKWHSHAVPSGRVPPPPRTRADPTPAAAATPNGTRTQCQVATTCDHPPAAHAVAGARVRADHAETLLFRKKTGGARCERRDGGASRCQVALARSDTWHTAPTRTERERHACACACACERVPTAPTESRMKRSRRRRRPEDLTSGWTGHPPIEGVRPGGGCHMAIPTGEGRPPVRSGQ